MADAEFPIPLPIVGQDVVKDAPLPEPWGVLLAHPNPDGSRKSCVNCMMWARTDQCAVHDPDLIITADHVCGYHVFGEPMEVMSDHPGIQHVDPDYSGLDLVPGGTSCDLCIYYEAIGENYEAADEDGGWCHQVSAPDMGPPAPVGPLMCCAAWDDGSETELEPENPELSELEPEPVETPPLPDNEGNPY